MAKFFLEQMTPDKSLLMRQDNGAWLFGENAVIRRVYDGIVLNKLPQDFIESQAESEAIAASDLFSDSEFSCAFKPVLVVVHLGYACNLKCSYCYAPKMTGALSAGNMERVAQFISEIENDVTVQFMGGEPLLYLDQMAEFITFSLSLRKGHKTDFAIQTNGLLLGNKGTRDRLKDCGIGFGISFDGPGELGRDRFGSNCQILSEQYESIIKALREEGFDFGLLSVVTPSNIHNLRNLLDWCILQGIPRIKLNPIIKTNGNPSYYKQLKTAILDLYDYWVGNSLYEKIEINNFNDFETNILSRLRPYMCRKIPCGAGRDQVAIDVSGEVFPCDYLIGQRVFSLGGLHGGDLARIAASEVRTCLMDQQAQQQSECSECAFLSICGNCASEAQFCLGKVAGPRPTCPMDKALIKKIIIELNTNQIYCEHVLAR